MNTDRHRNSDREHRIKGRRQRIETGLLQQAHAVAQGPDDGDEPTEQGMGQLLLVQSVASMRHLQESFQEDLAAVQHSCQHKEHERTEAKQVLQEELWMMFLDMSEAGQPLAASIGDSWAALLDITSAQDLFGAVGKQQGDCSRALSLKSTLLAAMKRALVTKEAHYIQTLGSHAQEMEDLLIQMKAQSQVLSEEQNEQTKQLSSALSEERSRILKDCQVKLEGQLEQRAAAEQAFLDRYLAAASQYQQDLNEASNKAADVHERLREILDGEVQQQELRLACLHSANQQREDQLAYSSRTLHEHTEERTVLLEQQKRQIAQLHDSLHTLKQNHARSEREHAALDEALTRGYINNLKVHASQQDRAQAYRRIERAKHSRVLELKAHETQGMLRKLVQLQSFTDATMPSCMLHTNVRLDTLTHRILA